MTRRGIRCAAVAAAAAAWVASSTRAANPAFPEAVGFGANATGGRGGTIYHVTNLNDSGAGSFRDAVSASNRIIVFDVGGYIHLNSAITAKGNLTIAGQTAPGAGIGVMGAEVSFAGGSSPNSNDVVRYFHFRDGSIDPNWQGLNSASSHANGLNLGDTSNMIFDHVSVAFGAYNNIDAVGNNGADNLTIQNSIIADPIQSQQFNIHIEAVGAQATMVNNIFANAGGRSVLAKENLQFANNVIYDYGYAFGTGNSSGAFKYDLLNNYFKAGPTNSDGSSNWFQLDSNQSAYSSGNLLDHTAGTLSGASTSPSGVTVLNSPWSPATAALPLVSASAAYTAVAGNKGDVTSGNAGPSLRYDQVDAQVVSQVQSQGSTGKLVNTEADTGLGNGGFGVLANTSRPTGWDTDGDGMPDHWETAHGLNPNSTADMNTTGADGYSHLEEYLNEVGGAHQDSIRTDNGGDWATTASWNNRLPLYSDRAFVKGNGSANGLLSVSQIGAAAWRVYIGGNGPAAGEKLSVTNGSLDVTDTINVGYQNNAALQVSGGAVSASEILLGSATTSYTGSLSLSGGLLQTLAIDAAGAGGTFSWNGGTLLSIGDGTFSVPTTLGANGGTFNANGNSPLFTGAIGGVGALTKISSGTLVLTASNNYSGGTVIGTASTNGGNLELASNNAAGTGSISIAAAGGVVQLADGVTVSNNINTAYGFECIDVPDDNATGTYAGSLTPNGASALRVEASGSNAVLNLTGSISAGNKLFILKTGNMVVSNNGSVTSTAGGGVIGRATGATNLTIQNTANFSTGALSMGGGQPITTASIDVRDTATFSTGTASLDLLSTTTAIASTNLSLDGGISTVGGIVKSSIGSTQTAVIDFNGGTLRYGGTGPNASFLPALAGLTAAVQSGGAVIDDGGQSITIAQPFTHDTALGSNLDGGLTKWGAGTLILTASNSYTGGTVVNAGVLKVGAANAIPHTTGTSRGIVTVNSTLDLGGFSPTINTLSGTGIVDNSAAGPVTLTVGDNDATNTSSPFNGVIQNTAGTVSLTKIGVGTFRMQTAASTYSGDTTVSAGLLDLNLASVLPSGVGKGDVKINTGATLGIRFNESINGLADGASGGGIVQSLSSTTKTLSIGNDNQNAAFSGIIQDGSTGKIALAKFGTATQTLSGSNNYSGGTNVWAGRLQLTGSIAGVTSVNNGGAVGGSGTFGGNVTVNTGGTVAPVGAVTTHVTGNVTFASGSTYAAQLDSTAGQSDTLSMTGLLDVTATNDTLALSDVHPGLYHGSYTIAKYGTLSGVFNLVTGLPTGYQVDYGTVTSNAITLDAIPAPEPSALCLFAAVPIGLLTRRRRRRLLQS